MSRDPSAHDTAERIARLALTDPRRVGLPGHTAAPSADGARVRLLGQGESYRVWRLDVPGHPPLVVRVARRAPEDLPRPMREEFTALGLLPTASAPRPCC
ncbi:hypothetical protein DN402_33490 [Streptomyces sp. SW4]|nr:hypothetical protein DN402_33490 [Streptomyces sp. SW4]